MSGPRASGSTVGEASTMAATNQVPGGAWAGAVGAPPLPAHSVKEPTLLGEAIGPDGAIASQDGVQRVADAVAHVVAAQSLGVDQLLPFATSAIRDAVNRDEDRAHRADVRSWPERSPRTRRWRPWPCARSRRPRPGPTVARGSPGCLRHGFAGLLRVDAGPRQVAVEQAGHDGVREQHRDGGAADPVLASAWVLCGVEHGVGSDLGLVDRRDGRAAGPRSRPSSVNKNRAQSGESKEASKTSTKDVVASFGNARVPRPHDVHMGPCH